MLRWVVGHVASMGENGIVYSVWGNLNERDYLEDLSIHGRIILKWILRKQGGRVSTGFIWLWIGTSAGLL
jgi:hypothetical protein